MEKKELSEKSTKEEVAEFFNKFLSFNDGDAKIFINEYISGDVLPLITTEELRKLGFKLSTLKRIHKYIKENIDKFKEIKINETITFDSTNEELKKFFKNHLDFDYELNYLDGKKLLKLKEEDMEKLGMKFGQRKRLINAQKQILTNFVRNIQSFKELYIIFDNFNTKEIDREFTLLINTLFSKFVSNSLDYSDNEYKNVFILFDNILIINNNNKLDLDNICSIFEVNYNLACKYYLYLVKNKNMKYIFDKLIKHIISFYMNILPKHIYSHYFLEFILIQHGNEIIFNNIINIFNQMIFQENDFFQKGKNYKILCFQTLINFIKNSDKSLSSHLFESNFVIDEIMMMNKILNNLKNNNIKFNKICDLIDEDETLYEKILLVMDENEAKTIYSKLKDDIKICKEKIVNIENILDYYSTFYKISKEEIIKTIKIKLPELQEKEIDKLKNIEINNYLNIKNFYIDEALEESKNIKYKYSSFFMSIYNNNINIYKNKFSEDKIFKTSIKDYNNLIKILIEKLKQNLSLFDVDNIELIIEVIKNKKFNMKKEIDLIEEEYPLFKNNNDYIKNTFFNDLFDFTKKYEIVKFIEGIIQFIELNNKINDSLSSNYIEYFKNIYNLIISNKIDEKKSKKIISSMKFNVYYSKSENYLKRIFRALFEKNESLLFLKKVKESIINGQTDYSFYNSKDISNFIDFYDFIKKLIFDNKNIVKDEELFKLINIEKEKDKDIENILNKMNNIFFNFIKNNDINNMNINSKEGKNNNINEVQPKNKIINEITNNSIQFEIQFNYNQNMIKIQCNNLNEKMKDIFNRYAAKSLINDLSNFYFIYGGNIINPESILSSILSNEDKYRNIMTILVNSNINLPTENSLIKSNFVICPECKEPINLKIKNYKINLYGCKNNHNIDNIFFKDYEKSQNLDLKKIICDNCKEKNKFESYKYEFYKCVTCSKNLCVLCKSTHEKEHIIFDYDKRYTLCQNHSESFCFYCKTCKKNLCINCEKKHLNHDIISYGSILPDIEEEKINLNSLKKEIDKFSKNISDIIKRLNILKENMEKYYEIFNNTIKTIENKNRNFEVINNINEIIKDDILNDLCKINNENNIKNRINLMFDIIDKIELNKKEKNDEITLIYNIDKNTNVIKIFDSEFVNTNKNNCKIIYKNKEYELMENFKFNIDNNIEEEKILEIKLKGINSITNANRMFYKCEQLFSLPDIYNWDISNVIKMNDMFIECKHLKEIPKKFIK